jgi:hypothetical protein
LVDPPAVAELTFAHAPSASRRRANRASPCAPRRPRGMARRQARRVVQSRTARGVRGRRLCAHRLSARHRGVSVRGAVLPGTWPGHRACARRPGGFPPVPVPRPADKVRQSPVVGPDGDPRPPEPVLARHDRRRRIPLHIQNASRSAPRRVGWRGL